MLNNATMSPLTMSSIPNGAQKRLKRTVGNQNLSPKGQYEVGYDEPLSGAEISPLDSQMEQIKNETENPENTKQKDSTQVEQDPEDEEELRRLLLPNVSELPLTPPSAVESNFVSYFAPDFMKPGHDQYVYRHANGLCVIGLAPAHLAFKDKGGIMAVDFNVGKSDRSEIKVSGKRKKNAQHFESNTALCKVSANDASYVVRCCVKGSLLEVNDRLIKQPELLNSFANREGYIAIIMPKPADWLKVKASLLGFDEYKKLRGL